MKTIEQLRKEREPFGGDSYKRIWENGKAQCGCELVYEKEHKDVLKLCVFHKQINDEKEAGKEKG